MITNSGSNTLYRPQCKNNSTAYKFSEKPLGYGTLTFA